MSLILYGGDSKSAMRCLVAKERDFQGGRRSLRWRRKSPTLAHHAQTEMLRERGGRKSDGRRRF